jgi:starch phosphorylase
LALDALSYSIDWYHLNEGHAAFAYVQKALGLNDSERKTLQEKFGYTCHTPVAAGHDRFSMGLSEQVLSDEMTQIVRQLGSDPEQKEMINLTRLAMNSAHQINAVSQLHGKVTQLQFPDFKDKLKAITNGVHHHTWMSDSVGRLLDEYQAKVGPWRKDPTCLKKVKTLVRDQEFRQALWKVHQENKTNLCNLLSPWKLDTNVFTIAWARRIASYKRPGLLLHDTEKLIEIAKSMGPIQIIIAGKAHPNDNVGRSIISDMLNCIDQMNMLYQDVKILMLENYDTYFGKLLTSSVDVWLNNPLPPFEASGTSGMKALLNGVLQLSTLDGWVAEATDAGIGKIFGYRAPDGVFDSEHNLRLDEDSKKLYKALNEFVELYYQTNRAGTLNVNSEWLDMMIHCIESAAFFNTHRMVREYAEKMWETPIPVS